MEEKARKIVLDVVIIRWTTQMRERERDDDEDEEKDENENDNIEEEDKEDNQEKSITGATTECT